MLGPFAPYSTLMPLKSVFRVLPKNGQTLSRTVSPRSNQIVSYDPFKLQGHPNPLRQKASEQPPYPAFRRRGGLLNSKSQHNCPILITRTIRMPIKYRIHPAIGIARLVTARMTFLSARRRPGFRPRWTNRTGPRPSPASIRISRAGSSDRARVFGSTNTPRTLGVL